MDRRLSYLMLVAGVALFSACSPDRGAEDTGSWEPGADASPDVTDDAEDPPPDDTAAPDTADPGQPDPSPDTDTDSGVPDTRTPDTGPGGGGSDGGDCSSDSDSDGLTDCEEAQMCTDPNEGDTDGDSLSDFEEFQHQTDPCSIDSDGDEATDKEEVDFGLDPNRPNDELWVLNACETPQAEAVEFHENGTGNWTLALPTAFDNYTELTISGSTGPMTAAAVYDDPATEIAGALVSKETASGNSSPTDLLRDEVQDALDVVRSEDRDGQDTTGAEFDTHDDKVAAVGEYLVPTDDKISVRRMRQTLLMELASFDNTQVTGLPNTAGNGYDAFRVFVSVIFRTYSGAPDQTLISLSISPDEQYQRLDEVRFRMDDLTNTTNIAEQVDDNLTKCGTFPASEKTPKAEFYWVLDQSGSMDTNNRKVANFSEQFQAEVQNTPLDYRMGVTNMVPGNDGHLRVPPGWHTSPGTFRTEIDEAVIHCTDTNSWDCHTSDEYGLDIARAGIKYMRGNTSAQPLPPERARTDAEIITIFMSDEEANSIKDDGESVEPYKTFFKDRTTAYAIVGGEDCEEDGTAYKDVALATGGKFASLCAKDLTQTIRDIIISATGGTTPYTLPQTPISSSLRVVVDGEWVPRSTEDGFEYFEEHNAIAFFGSYQPTPASEDEDGPGDYVAIHYETFKDRCKPSATNNCLP